MKIQFSPPDITEEEIEEVVDTLKSGWITTGPKTKRFEKEIAAYCKTKRAVCLNSATAGLELILRICGIGPGDEVITSAYTYTASASVIEHVGAKIVLCDTAPNSYQMDLEQLSCLITSKTKAIIAVDLAGVIAEYDKIFEIVAAKKSIFKPTKNKVQQQLKRILVVADAAHSFGATKNNLKSGNFADFSSFSFHAVKNLTTAEGGAVTWTLQNKFDDQWLYQQFMLWSLHGQSKDALSKSQKGAWEYDVSLLGYKANMTDIMASIGLVQLKRYDDLLKRRQEIVKKYESGFANLPVNLISHYGQNFQSSAHLCLMRVEQINEEKRNEIIKQLAEIDIPTNVHYKPLPMHTGYQRLGFKIENYPQSYQQYQNEITLPLHTLLTDQQVDKIINGVQNILGNI